MWVQHSTSIQRHYKPPYKYFKIFQVRTLQKTVIQYRWIEWIPRDAQPPSNHKMNSCIEVWGLKQYPHRNQMLPRDATNPRSNKTLHVLSRIKPASCINYDILQLPGNMWHPSCTINLRSQLTYGRPIVPHGYRGSPMLAAPISIFRRCYAAASTSEASLAYTMCEDKASSKQMWRWIPWLYTLHERGIKREGPGSVGFSSTMHLSYGLHLEVWFSLILT